ncbi:protocatechuate dioxygenase [Embleya hyalina]|uniref:Protocatechuate dioxygenase n=1 Tax=Embleya hyalina TaxID=516124 RepID=A0A401Z543_9ACTN|nr:protocatechuate dioxygenase [Embleya hyalina]GCE01946.1 protocatechuate dioxygenase [Embleya hyalina]
MSHDHHEGHRVSRRTALAGIGSIGLGALLGACSDADNGGSARATTTTGATATVSPRATTTPDIGSLFEGAGTCTLTQQTTQGPYYFDADKIRSDIREDRDGVRLRLAVRIQDSETCRAIPNAVVEIWHCDAAGLYSGAENLSGGGGAGGAPRGGTPPPGAGAPPQGSPGGGGGGGGDLTPQDDKRYLRGAQVTDNQGIVQFTTIWPGWYRGRTVHVHAMVHIDNERTLTTQLMMDESLNSTVFAEPPYAEHTGRDTFNDGDNIYKPTMLLDITRDGDGYLGAITLAADPDKNGK